ncbi:MAG: hypothetical protein J0M07_03820 [Anaerolineae bacterium]|nr:hypothetical protein [Anaerolineae bacterium]
MQLYAEKSGNHIVQGKPYNLRVQRWGTYRLNISRIRLNRRIEWILTIWWTLVVIEFEQPESN